MILLGLGIWFSISSAERAPATQRQIQSIPSTLKKTALDELVVLLKNGNNFQLTKIEVSLETESSIVLEEIKQSNNQVKDHLVFILSDEDISIFSKVEELKALEKEIIAQLNLFLVTGKIKKVQLKGTFLN